LAATDTAALRAGDIYRFFDLAVQMRLDLIESKVLRDRRYHLKAYKQCVTGKDFIDWLVKNNQVMSRVEGAAVGCSMVEHGILHHVVDDHHFKDAGLFYRFEIFD
jgi:phosphatidylinositol 3,4,5-trisphosphate-dependent Rac exchanger 2 protein